LAAALVGDDLLAVIWLRRFWPAALFGGNFGQRLFLAAILGGENLVAAIWAAAILGGGSWWQRFVDMRGHGVWTGAAVFLVGNR